jgi:hypothetical protein
MGDDDLIFLRASALIKDRETIAISHLKTVDHHESCRDNILLTSTQRQKLVDVRVFEKRKKKGHPPG